MIDVFVFSVIQVKELYKTLFVDLNTMCRNEVGETRKKCLSVMDEMKIEREKMLKRAVSVLLIIFII